jgi:hypothetical protein
MAMADAENQSSIEDTSDRMYRHVWRVAAKRMGFDRSDAA